MHRALQIPDIIQEICIFQESFKRDDYARGATALLAFALTCRRFKEPALDALWLYMRSLVPLFELLSNYQSNEDDDDSDITSDSGDDTLGFISGALTDDDLALVSLYAARIRIYEQTRWHETSTSAYFRLLHALQTPYLLPRLRSLTMYTPSAREELLFFVHPGLRSLNIDYFGGSTNQRNIGAAAVLHSVRRICPSIVSLDLFNPLTTDIIDAITALPSLRSLKLDTPLPRSGTFKIPAKLLRDLKSSEVIEALELGGISAFRLKTAKTPSPAMLPRLKVLQLTPSIDSFKRAGTLIPNVENLPSLQALVVTLRSRNNESDSSYSAIKHMCSGLAHSFPNLCRLSLKCGFFSGESAECSAYPVIAELPTTIRSLFIATGSLFSDLTMEDIQSLASRMPALEKLTYLYDSDRFGKSGFRLLVHISSTLPDLRRLCVYINGTSKLPDCTKLSLSCSQLEELEIEGSGAAPSSSSAINAARLLHRLFPRLVVVKLPKQWKDVLEVLQGLHQARDDERARVEGLPPLHTR